ncbi:MULTISPECIES: hypothetical protein [unclassified Lysinibacillus]|uniref:hypothetical protein n=1 Tax=unclassified Lysinibacillus TaxID=2636778 RepID=UPI00382C36C3
MNVSGIERIPTSRLQTYQRGEKLEAYLTQPFYTAEPFTNKPGQSVSLKDTLNDVQEIMNGALDSRDASELVFIGSLQS